MRRAMRPRPPYPAIGGATSGAPIALPARGGDLAGPSGVPDYEPDRPPPPHVAEGWRLGVERRRRHSISAGEWRRHGRLRRAGWRGGPPRACLIEPCVVP